MKEGCRNDVHQPEALMSFPWRKEVTSKPAVGIVQQIVIIQTIVVAIREEKSRRPGLSEAIEASFDVLISGAALFED